MSAIDSTSGRLYSEFVRLLFLQIHRETDRFFAASGVQLAQTDRDQFHFRRTVFSSQLKIRVGLVLTNTRRVDSSALVLSLSLHRHSYIGLVFSYRFIDS
jgi:hypothetical protein